MFAANGFTISNVNASGTSDDQPNFVTYPIPSNSGGATMEPAFDTTTGTYVQHGTHFCCYK